MAMRRDIVSPKAAQSRPKTVAVGVTSAFSNLDKVARLIPQIADNSSSDHPRSGRSVLKSFRHSVAEGRACFWGVHMWEYFPYTGISKGKIKRVIILDALS